MSQTLRQHLLDIREQYGTLTPQTTLEAARDPSHPLHSRFEWDDDVAAEAHRITQARNLIRSVKLHVKRQDNPDKAPTQLRAFVSISKDTGQVYEPLEEVLQDDFTRTLLLNQMKREINSLIQRYEALEEFIPALQEAISPLVTAAG